MLETRMGTVPRTSSIQPAILVRLSPSTAMAADNANTTTARIGP